MSDSFGDFSSDYRQKDILPRSLHPNSARWSRYPYGMVTGTFLPETAMYTPRSFKVEDLKTIHPFIKEHSFATIVSVNEGCPSATHLPFLLDTRRGEFGTLRAHMARANPLWKSWTPDTEVLVIFTGAHAYISPGWYETQTTVPTWNYAAIHVYGTPTLLPNTEALQALVTEQVALYEAKEDSSWDQSLMADIMETELQAIVGFEIPISRIEGKFKFNQNRSQADQEGVVAALERSGCPFKRTTGAFMRTLGRR
jgi:transcriptional regulator